MARISEYEIKGNSAEEKKYPLLRLGVADNFVSRFRGLMLRKSLDGIDGLLLSPCSSVHMCFMRFPLDIVYLDEDYRIIKIVPRLNPWLGMSCCPRAKAAIELAAGRSAELGLTEGCLINPRPR